MALHSGSSSRMKAIVRHTLLPRRFSRMYNDGQVPIATSGTNNVIYAYSADNTQNFDYHDGN